jgi:predicted transposase YbfD/YdcC
VDGADHRPFGGYLLDPSHQELAEPSCLLDLSEHRLDYLLTQSVAAAAPASPELCRHGGEPASGAIRAFAGRGRRTMLLPPGRHVAADPLLCQAFQVGFAAIAGIRRELQVLSAFAVDTALVLAHIEIDEKSNEIPAVQKLLEELDVAGHIVTCDAMHCQKKPSKLRPFQPATGLWKTSDETSFYLSNRLIDANHAAVAIRKHWGIENKLHYHVPGVVGRHGFRTLLGFEIRRDCES